MKRSERFRAATAAAVCGGPAATGRQRLATAAADGVFGPRPGRAGQSRLALAEAQQSPGPRPVCFVRPVSGRVARCQHTPQPPTRRSVATIGADTVSQPPSLAALLAALGPLHPAANSLRGRGPMLSRQRCGGALQLPCLSGRDWKRTSPGPASSTGRRSRSRCSTLAAHCRSDGPRQGLRSTHDTRAAEVGCGHAPGPRWVIIIGCRFASGRVTSERGLAAQNAQRRLHQACARPGPAYEAGCWGGLAEPNGRSPRRPARARRAAQGGWAAARGNCFAQHRQQDRARRREGVGRGPSRAAGPATRGLFPSHGARHGPPLTMALLPV